MFKFAFVFVVLVGIGFAGLWMLNPGQLVVDGIASNGALLSTLSAWAWAYKVHALGIVGVSVVMAILSSVSGKSASVREVERRHR